MNAERERLRLLREKAEQIEAGLPAWDGESPAVLVSFTDPVTQMRLTQCFVPVAAAPLARPRLRLVGEAS
ncbi:hypothetical protein ACI3K5_23780 [Streptomyces sp. MPA0124]|uniref:hypothetical protein n=1 Tax=Streptomyces sp. MPA0124 TaxID=3378069 RepID=UPI003853F212